MEEEIDKEVVIGKIATFSTVEILLNDKQEMLFDSIIDAPYIFIHFKRILNTSRNFDNVKLIGYTRNKRKEMIADIFVSK